MVDMWFYEFRCGRTYTSDAERSERSIGVSTYATIEKIYDVVLTNRSLKVSKIVEALGISQHSMAIQKMGVAFAYSSQ